ncbi:putative aspartic proteinase-like protein 2-like isoform X2 [Capsicum annuum]|uniref:Peptidase A1 domain-containing protein n=1 Tax=Capsicum annuum TaxID=4072 RepID=A0A2G2Y7G9_CAPAN|nr:putative aspartic proteinase-like protein 2-like isoform X2 [Capsicum annuum]PHT65697.1 hypothetical protein T459_30122 [Capsicum annuum]
MSSSFGLLGEDVLSFGNLSDLGPQRAIFGCEIAETGDPYNQRADGIMGLGRRDVIIVDQLVEKHVISDSFTLCYVVSDGNNPYYNIELKEILVPGKPLKMNPWVFGGKHGAILDSGTTYAYLPEPVFIAFNSIVRYLMKELHSMKQIKGSDPSFNDICFSGDGSDVSQLAMNFPPVNMVFGDGNKPTLSYEKYFQIYWLLLRGTYCLGIFPNGKNPTSLLGGTSYYLTKNKRIGFWKTNCFKLWD